MKARLVPHAVNHFQRQAAALRQAGRFAEAVGVWHAILRAKPDDWRVALELKADLAASHQYADSDSLFRRAARSLPDEQFLSHYAPLWTFYGNDLPFLAQRARAVLARNPGDPQAQRLLGTVLIQQRRWAAAERHFDRVPASPESAANHALARLYQRLTRRMPVSDDTYEVAVINLDSNPGRLQDIAVAFRSTAVPRFRIPGVQGSQLPMAAVHRLARADGPSMRGTLGCFLGHAAAWEAMLARGLAHCLIIEDDVVPQVPLPGGLGALGLPGGFDLCFVNDRMQPVWPASRIAASDAFQAVPLAESFATFPADNNAPGTDGYILSAAGAGKLLAWTRQDGFAHDVDWRLLAYSLSDRECAGLPRDSHAWTVLDGLRREVPRAARLRSYALHPALIRTVPVSSDREEQDRKRG